MVNSDGVVLFANRRASALFLDEHLCGKPVEALLPPELRDRHRGHRHGYIAAPERREMGEGRELQAQRADGSLFSVEVALNPVKRKGKTYVLCSVVDISERVELAEEREAILKRGLQQERVHSLGMLASGIAHDFNNLFIGILGNVDVALDSVDPDSLAAECLIDARAASQQAADLASQLTVYSGKGERALGNLDLSLATGQLAMLLRESVPDNVALHLDLPRDLPIVYADQNQVRQVVMNLISNAVQAIGDAPGQVWIRSSVVEIAAGEPPELDLELAPGRYATVEVKDTGCGMSPQTIERMFEPFFTTKERGHGLGLAATLGILRGHGGGLKVRSAEGAGTSITLLLPIAAQPLG